jgi:hypothetical protein
VEAFYVERFAQVDAQDAIVEPEFTSTQRPKRAAAVAAPEALKNLGQRKR